MFTRLQRRRGEWRPLGTVLALLLCLFILLDPTPGLAKYAAIIIDADSGEILHEVNADTRNYPASLTKMMTLYMTFEALDNGSLKLSEKMVVSRRASGQAPSKLGLKRGGTILVKDAILALVTKSANDVATVLAERLGKTEVNFARMMTKKGNELGMKRTTFRNASGLPNRRQLSTARELAVLAQALIKNHGKYYAYFSTADFSYKKRTYKNHNKLLKTYKGADGIKTGYIRASGFNLAASAVRNGRRIIGVLMGGRSAKSRNIQMAKLLDKGFSKIGVTTRSVENSPNNSPAITVTKKRTLTAGTTSSQNNSPSNSLVKKPQKGEWGIQVGAFSRYAPAHLTASRTLRRFSALLVGTKVVVYPVRDKKNLVFRSRLIGLDKNAAFRACENLKREGLACHAVSPKGDVSLALADKNDASTK